MKRWLWTDIDIASLVFFRIAVGILGFADLCGGLFYYHWYKNAFASDAFQFKYYGFEWAQVLPEPLMTAYFLVAMGLAIAVTVGWRYRLTAPLFAAAVTYYFLLEKAHYLNHGYFFCWVTWTMALLPVWRAFSVDAYRQPQVRSTTTARWTLVLVCGLMGFVYFFGGIAKLNSDWIGRAMPLKLWLNSKKDLFLIGPLLAKEGTAWFMSWGGAFFDLTITFFLLWKRSRKVAFAIVIFFHLTNHLVFNIGIFPYLSVVASALFFAPSWPRQWVHWGVKRFPRLALWQQRYLTRVQTVPENTSFWQKNSRYPTLISSALVLIVLIQVALPLRHHYFPGDVAWTEEVHRYAWRMMLRAKRGNGHFLIQDLTTGAEQKVYANELQDKQRRKLWTHPDMILQYAHHLRDQAAAKGQSVAIFAKVRVKLNDGKYAPYIDPTVDLAQIEWSYWEPSAWILAE